MNKMEMVSITNSSHYSIFYMLKYFQNHKCVAPVYTNKILEVKDILSLLNFRVSRLLSYWDILKHFSVFSNNKQYFSHLWWWRKKSDWKVYFQKFQDGVMIKLQHTWLQAENLLRTFYLEKEIVS